VTFGAGVFGINRASFQEWAVFAGETWKINATDVNAAITSGNAYVKLQEVTTGRWFTGSAWQNAEASILSLAAGANSALSVTVTPDTALVGRGTYRLIVTLSGTWDFTRTVQVTGPAAFPQIDAAAVIGNNIPAGATVAIALSGGPTWTLTPARPSFYAVDQAVGLGRVWTLTITHPTGAEVVGAPPGIGELFLGLSRTFVTFPGFPFDVQARDPAQIRLDNGTGGTEALSAAQRPLRNATMRFRSLEAGYTQAWQLLYLGTRAGVDPMVLIPEITDPGEVLFGRLLQDVAFTRAFINQRDFELTLSELPLPALP